MVLAVTGNASDPDAGDPIRLQGMQPGTAHPRLKDARDAEDPGLHRVKSAPESPKPKTGR